MVRRSTRVRNSTTKANENAANPSDGPGAQSNHRTASQPKGVLRPTNVASQPTPLQKTTPNQAVEAVRLMIKEFDAIVGMRRLQLGLDAHASRQQELARLEVEDPVAHYYAQTPAERAPYQLQAAAVLFQMAGGDIAGPVAALNLMKAQREAREREKRKAAALLLGAWRAGKAKKERGEGAGTVVEDSEKTKGKKRMAPEEETGGEEPPRKKMVRFGGEL